MEDHIAAALERHRKNTDLDKRNEFKWFTRYLELVAYRELFGHCNVPARYAHNKSLGRWVRKQRYNYHTDNLQPDRLELLKLIGFSFRLQKSNDWGEMFEKLSVRLKEKEYSRIQPKIDPYLYRWVMYQRRLYWKGKLDGKKLAKLREIGVDMSHRTLFRFENNYLKLLAFKKKNGHCYVCRSFGADDGLINFVKGLRRTRHTMGSERRKLLDAIGFVWNPQKRVTIVLNEQRGSRERLGHKHGLKEN